MGGSPPTRVITIAQGQTATLDRQRYSLHVDAIGPKGLGAAGHLQLTPRNVLTGNPGEAAGNGIVHITAGIGTVMPIDGRIYQSVQFTALGPYGAPLSPISTNTMSMSATLAVAFLRELRDDEPFPAFTRPLVPRALMYFSASGTAIAAAVNQTDSWTFPATGGFRLRVMHVFVQGVFTTITASIVNVTVVRAGETGANALITLATTGSRTAAGTYFALSDTVGSGNSAGGASVTLPGNGFLLFPGDSLQIAVDAQIGDSYTVRVQAYNESDA